MLFIVRNGRLIHPHPQNKHGLKNYSHQPTINTLINLYEGGLYRFTSRVLRALRSSTVLPTGRFSSNLSI